MGRGGRRTGTPGTAYGNRTDLNVPQPSITNRPGGQGSVQGETAALAADTQALPPTNPTISTSPVGFMGQGASGAGPTPDQVTPLSAPTQHPDEPLTTGLPTGPGAGPEVLSMQTPQATAWTSGQSMISVLAANPNASPALKTLAASLGAQF